MQDCKHENEMRFEVLGDYDGILYKQCKDCGRKINVHTSKAFTSSKCRKEYTPVYQYFFGKLVGYSTHKAEGLSYEDDINLPENLLWGGRGKDGTEEVIYKPIHSLSSEHIEAILEGEHTDNEEYILAFKKQLGVNSQKDILSE